jgi:hypothetical protein
MSEYYERPFPARYAVMGDKAESAFESVHPNAHRIGLNRPKLNMSRMEPALRYTPDYMKEDGVYEVMGFSSRGNASLKLKCEKLDALLRWSSLFATYLWVFDSGRKNTYCAPIGVWAEACYQHAERLHFPDNLRPYWNLSIDNFPCPATTLEEA